MKESYLKRKTISGQPVYCNHEEIIPAIYCYPFKHSFKVINQNDF